MTSIRLKSKTLTEIPRQWNSSVTWQMEVGLSSGKSKVSIPFTMIGCARSTTLMRSKSLRSPPMLGPAFLLLTWQLTMQRRFGLAMQIAKNGLNGLWMQQERHQLCGTKRMVGERSPRQLTIGWRSMTRMEEVPIATKTSMASWFGVPMVAPILLQRWTVQEIPPPTMIVCRLVWCWDRVPMDFLTAREEMALMPQKGTQIGPTGTTTVRQWSAFGWSEDFTTCGKDRMTNREETASGKMAIYGGSWLLNLEGPIFHFHDFLPQTLVSRAHLAR